MVTSLPWNPKQRLSLTPWTLPQFEARVPARKFRGYRCTGSHAALDSVEKEEAEAHAVHDEGEPVAQVVALEPKV